MRLENNKIKNIRTDSSYLAKSWIDIPDNFVEIINNYLVFRSSQDLRTDKLLVYDAKEITNSIINKINAILKQVANANELSTIPNCQMFIRSRVLHELRKENGKNMNELIHIFGLVRNTQFHRAVEEYLVLENANN